ITPSSASDGSGSGLTITPYYIELDQNATSFASADFNSGWTNNAWTKSSLNANEAQAVRTKAKDNVGNESSWVNPSPVYKYTLADTPGAPTLVTVGSSAMDITIDTNSNSSITEYAIAVSFDNWLNTKYVQVDGTLGSAGGSAVWQTLASWGSPSRVTGLNSLYTYKVKIKARNNNQTETDFSAESQLGSLNQAPSVIINSAAQTQNGTQYVTINYTLTDAEANTCSLLNYEYSTDNSTWQT
ncbi:hypothetical protein COT20_00180, partial [bacterium (Candidatus Gribaldobacteria) CG08_land_8_20_14_0_20_39_15]